MVKSLFLLLFVALFMSHNTINHTSSLFNSEINSKDSIAVNPTELQTRHIIKQLIKDKSATILDVRTEQEYKDGHIDGSINIPLGELEQSIDSLEKNTNYVVVCRSGGRSAQAIKILSVQGFVKLYNGEVWEKLDEFLKSDK